MESTSIHKKGSGPTGLGQHFGELYTPEEVASFLKVNQMTVYNWVKTGKIECHTLTRGKRKSTVRFDLNQIENFMQSRSRK